MIVDVTVQSLSKSILSTATLIPLSIGVGVAVEDIDFGCSSKLVACHNVEVKAVATEHHFDAEAISIFKIKIADFIEIDKDTLWVTPDVWEQLQIMSNVEWTIV